uniref:Proteasome alpha-type subunits domain-containing protein n=1 Tax=Ditylenchus dipsaci TaxID=166011 RepID=A0A915ET03_9BILA
MGNTAYEMFLTRSEYDRGVNTFSPEGRLFQVEYAIETVKLGATSIGIRTSAGVVLAAEKRATSSLLVNDSINKISKVDDHIATTFAGLIADSRTLVNHARQEAQSFWFTYNSKIRVKNVTQSVANIALHFGDDDSKSEWDVLSCCLAFGGVDRLGPRSFISIFRDVHRLRSQSIGAASDGAEQQLKEKYQETMTIAEAEMLALNILKQVMEEKLSSSMSK